MKKFSMKKLALLLGVMVWAGVWTTDVSASTVFYLTDNMGTYYFRASKDFLVDHNGIIIWNTILVHKSDESLSTGLIIYDSNYELLTIKIFDDEAWIGYSVELNLNSDTGYLTNYNGDSGSTTIYDLGTFEE